MNVKGPEAVPRPPKGSASAHIPGTATGREDAVRQVVSARAAQRRRGVVVSTLLLVALAVAFCLALAYGDIVVPLPDVLGALAGGGDAGAHFIVVELRLPRALTGLLVGVGFGLSGALFQALLRNPLASPDVIGISHGASAAGVVASVLFGVSGLGLSAAALAGSLATAALIYVLGRTKGTSGYRFVLVGIGVGAALLSVISFVLTSSKVTEAQNALVWLTGSLNGSSLGQMWPCLVGLAALSPLTWVLARPMGALQLGDETAASVGVRVERARFGLLACAAALAGVATAAAGPVAFVAFVSAPLARRLAPGSGAALVPSALVGGVLVLAADFTAQHLLWSTQFPVGVVTSLIGGPYLLWLLARANREGRGG